jgi:hypothetical protein
MGNYINKLGVVCKLQNEIPKRRKKDQIITIKCKILESHNQGDIGKEFQISETMFYRDWKEI